MVCDSIIRRRLLAGALAASVCARSLATVCQLSLCGWSAIHGGSGMRKIAAQRLGIALVERAHLAQPLDGMIVAADTDAALAEQVVKLLIALGRKPVRSIIDRVREKICARSTMAWRAMAKVNWACALRGPGRRQSAAPKYRGWQSMR